MQPGQQLPGAEHSPSPAAQHVQQQPQQADSLEAAAAWLISCSHTWIRTSRFVLYASGGVVLVCWCVMYLSVAAPLHTLARHIVCATPVHPNSSNTHTHRAKARPPSTFCAQGCPCCLQVTPATAPAGESGCVDVPLTPVCCVCVQRWEQNARRSTHVPSVLAGAPALNTACVYTT